MITKRHKRVIPDERFASIKNIHHLGIHMIGVGTKHFDGATNGPSFGSSNGIPKAITLIQASGSNIFGPGDNMCQPVTESKNLRKKIISSPISFSICGTINSILTTFQNSLLKTELHQE